MFGVPIQNEVKMSWTLCTSGAAIAKAGKNANSTIVASTATLAEWSDEAEGSICAFTRKDWITDYSTIKTNFKPCLADCASDLIAMKIINYDMSGFSKLLEAETMLDVLRDNSSRNLTLLNNDNKKEILF